MIITLSTNKRIIFLLSQLISEPGICEKIVEIKDEEEKKDALKYHYERWENIGGVCIIIYTIHMWVNFLLYMMKIITLLKKIINQFSIT